MMNRFMAKWVAGDRFAQAQWLSAGTAQPESQLSTGGGSSGWFVSIGLLAAVLLTVTFFRNRSRSGSSSKRVGRKTAAPIFTAKDRSIIELLSEIVDIISSVEK